MRKIYVNDLKRIIVWEEADECLYGNLKTELFFVIKTDEKDPEFMPYQYGLAEGVILGYSSSIAHAKTMCALYLYDNYNAIMRNNELLTI